jgi:hypothetical protein
MKKQAMILLVIVCLFAISMPVGVAADPNEYKEVKYANGVSNDDIIVVFRDGDFNASEKYFFYVATNQWAWESRNTQRHLSFDFLSS